MTDIAEWTQQAEDGDIHAMWELAVAYLFGDGVEKDRAKADEWFAKRFPILLKRAEPEDTEALFDLGWAYILAWAWR